MPVNLNGNIVVASGVTYSSIWVKRITRGNLSLYLDALNPNSYPGSGTVWYDLSGNGYNAGLSGTTSYANGYIDLGSSTDVTNYITIPSGCLNGFDEFTVEMWLYIHATNAIDTFLTCGAGNDFLWYFNGRTGLDYQNTVNSSTTYNTSLTTPFQFAATGAKDGKITTYKDGSLVTTFRNTTYISVTSSIGVVLGNEMDSSSGGFDATQKFLGKYAIVRFYNRELNPYEIAENFQGDRQRFGI